MIITEILERNARIYGGETALVERDPAQNSRKEITWDEFNTLANRTANALISRGVKKGDKVIHLMMNSIHWLPTYFGILRTGAWVVPINFRFSASDIQRAALFSEAKAILFGEEFIERLDAIKDQLDKTIETYVFTGESGKEPEYAEKYNDFISSGSEDKPEVPINLLDSAALYFTSGTTGEPKAVHITHRNLEFACYIESRHHNQTHNDNFLCIPPLYHTGAKMHWFGNFIVGAKTVILKGITPDYILRAVSEEKATIVWLLVPWAHDILIAIEDGEISLDDYDLSQWRLMHIGAQPVPPELIKKWKKVFPHHDYDTNYGLTEATGPGCVHLGLENGHKVGAIGLPGFDWDCMIFDWESFALDRKLKSVPRGEIGEVAVKGPGVMKEYYKNPEATASTIVDGWLLTGDIGRKDEDGFIWLVDRKKDVIITGGENIFPVEIEDFFMENNNVRDIAVIGVPDERLGEITAAIIEVKESGSLSPEEVTEFCKDLPRYKRPRKVIFDRVPRNPTGKIDKISLRKKYGVNKG